MDLQKYREASLQTWDAMAPGWEDRREWLLATTGVVNDWLIEQADPQPGQTYLDVAAGTGDLGFKAAERVGADGKLLTTDFSPGDARGGASQRRGARPRQRRVPRARRRADGSRRRQRRRGGVPLGLHADGRPGRGAARDAARPARRRPAGAGRLADARPQPVGRDPRDDAGAARPRAAARARRARHLRHGRARTASWSWSPAPASTSPGRGADLRVALRGRTTCGTRSPAWPGRSGSGDQGSSPRTSSATRAPRSRAGMAQFRPTTSWSCRRPAGARSPARSRAPRAWARSTITGAGLEGRWVASGSPGAQPCPAAGPRAGSATLALAGRPTTAARRTAAWVGLLSPIASARARGRRAHGQRQRPGARHRSTGRVAATRLVVEAHQRDHVARRRRRSRSDARHQPGLPGKTGCVADPAAARELVPDLLREGEVERRGRRAGGRSPAARRLKANSPRGPVPPRRRART